MFKERKINEYILPKKIVGNDEFMNTNSIFVRF